MAFSDEEVQSLDQGIQSIADGPAQARVRAIGGVEANPDQAARSLELSARTGVHPDVIDLDPERFDQQYKEQEAAAVAGSDPHLERYLNSYPLAAKVSNDDFVQLGVVSKALKKLTTDAFGEAWKGAKEGFGGESILPQIPISDPKYLSELLSPIGRAMTGAVHGAAKGGGSILHNLTGVDQDKAEREIGGMLEWAMMRGDINLIHQPEAIPKAKELVDHGLPYALNGEAPPPGIHEVFDEVHKERAKADSDALKKAEKEAFKSTTRERSPDALEAFLRSPTEGRTIGISADAVRELYKDKEPTPDDGILGWVPDISARLREAEATGGDIDVPLSSWLARVEPEVANALHDNIRIRPDGMTLEETKGPKAPESEDFQKAEPVVLGPDDLARKESALAPMAESGQTLRLKKVGTDGDYDTFELHGDRGKVGEITASFNGKSGLVYIENIVGYKPREGKGRKQLGINSFGVGAIRPLIRQLKQEYPGMTEIGGYRVSGARDKAGTTDWVQIPIGAGEKDITSFAEAIGLGPEGWDSIEPTPTRDLTPEKAYAGGENVEMGNDYAIPKMHFKAKDLLDNIDLDHLTGVPKILGAFFRGKLGELVGDVEVRVIHQADMDELTAKYLGRGPGTPGFYSPSGHYIALTDSLLRRDAGQATHVIIHEAAHAATVRAMEANPILKQHVRDLMGEVKEFLEDADPSSLDEHHYAFQNEREFLAEAFGKPAFQEVLATSPISPELAKRMGLSKDTKTIWDAVRNFVAGTIEKLLGIRPDQTIMDGVLKLGEEFEKAAKEGAKTEKRLREHYNKLTEDWLKKANDELELKGKNDEAVKKLQEDFEKFKRGLDFAPDPLFENAKADYIKQIGKGETDVPSTEDLTKLIAKIVKAEKDQYGLDDKTYSEIERLKRRTDAGDDEAMRKLAAIQDNLPNLPELDLPSIDDLKQLRFEYENMEKKEWENDSEYKDGLSRVLKRHVFGFTEGKDFDRAIFRKAFEEAQAHGIDTKALGNDILNRVLSEVSSPSDKALLREEFKKFTQPKLPDISLAPPDPLFENAKAVGLSQASFKRYQELINKRNLEDEARQLARATKEQERKQTAEWKENEKAVRAEATENINQRPDVAADDFLREGPFTDVKNGRVKLSADAFSDVQKASLPKDYVGKGGTDPSALAGFFGFSSGEALVQRLSQLTEARENLGLTPVEYKKYLIDQETERQMQAKYGKLEENILQEARENVVSATQMDLLHEETMALAAKAGIEPSLSRQDIQKAVKKDFASYPLSSAKDMNKFLRSAGRAGQAAEDALLKGDPTEAFRQKQRQYLSVLLADEAKKLSKEFDRNEKFLKRFSQRQVSTVSQEYTDQIHGIMSQIGAPVRRSVRDLQKGLGGTTLENFVAAKEADLREVPVADFLYDPAFKKQLSQMTVEEFRAVDQSLKALAHNGRSELQVEKAGEKADLEAVRKSMVEQLEEFEAAKPPPLGQGRGKILGISVGAPKKALRTFVAAHLQMETLLNRWDKFDPKGVFNQYVMRPLAESSNRLAALEREYSKLVIDLKDKENLKETIENPLIIDPLSKTPDTPDGVPFIMSRKNLRAVMANMGNASNLEKLTKGYNVTPEALSLWVNNVAKKEDWDFVQKQGDIFAKLKTESDRMYERLSGIAPESIELTPIQTPFGEYKGWYHPIMYDRLREGGSKKLMGKSGIEEPEYYRATTPAGYTKKRTGYTAPLSLELDEVQTRMKQMLHDIAMREAVINAGKVFYDKDIRSAISKHSFLGPEVKDMLIPYLKDVANHSNIDSAAAHIGAQWSEFFRQNIISTLIGLNPGTVMKHGPTAAIQSLQEVGVGNFAREVKDLLKPGGGENWKFAMDTSEELQRRHRNYQETLGGGYKEAFQEQNLRTIVQHIGSYPVAISDLMSAVPTWLAEYRTQIESGASKGDAVFAADRAIRRAHGSTAMTNRPVVMRGGATAQWFSSVFGFFSHIMNRQVELVWRAGDTLDKAKNGELKEALAETPKLASGLFAYVIWPTLVEEMITPLSNDQHESWGAWAGKSLVKDLSASWIGVRDVVQAILSGHDPSMGLVGSMFKGGADVGKDVVAMATKGKERAGKLIEHGASALGAATGLTTAQMGRTGEFAYNVMSGKDKPKGIGEWLHGLRYGVSKQKKR